MSLQHPHVCKDKRLGQDEQNNQLPDTGKYPIMVGTSRSAFVLLRCVHEFFFFACTFLSRNFVVTSLVSLPHFLFRYPYDVATNLIRSVDDTRIHEDGNQVTPNATLCLPPHPSTFGTHIFFFLPFFLVAFVFLCCNAIATG